MVARTSGSVHKVGSNEDAQGYDGDRRNRHRQAHARLAVHGKEGLGRVDNIEAGVSRVGIEATGGYERGVTRHLQDQGFTVLVLQPAQVRALARLHLCRAEFDRIDATLIAACTHLLEPQARKPDPRLDELAERLTFIEQLEADIVCWKTRLEHTHDERLRGLIDADIKRLQAHRADELKRLLKAVRDHADLAQRLKLVLSVPGIGPRTGLALIVRMPELGNISREQAAALAGLAPFAQQSGSWTGRPTSPAGAKDSAARSTPLPSPPPSAGTRRSTPLPQAHPARQTPYRRPCCLRPKTPPLRQRRPRPRHPLDRKTGRCLMVATVADFCTAVLTQEAGAAPRRMRTPVDNAAAFPTGATTSATITNLMNLTHITVEGFGIRPRGGGASRRAARCRWSFWVAISNRQSAVSVAALASDQ